MACGGGEEELDNDLPQIAYREFTDKKVLEEGQHCVIYSARHPTFGVCCLRIFSKFYLVRDGMSGRLEREVNALARLQHPHIIDIWGFVMENHRLCQIQPLMPHGSLEDTLQRITIPWALKVRISHQITEAVCFLHDHNPQIVHKRLKSSNVLLDKDFNVKVSDILMTKNDAWMMQATQMKDITDRQRQARGDMSMYERPGWVIAHVAPENIRNINHKPTPAYDVFSFGVILWELMANAKPYPGLKTDRVYHLVSEGQLLTDEHLKADRPQFLRDVMISTFTLQPEQRPTLHSLRDTIRRKVDSPAANRDTKLCQDQFQEYQRRRREQKEARLAAEQAAILAANQRPVVQPQYPSLVQIRDEVQQRGIHAQVSHTTETVVTSQVAQPESEMDDDEHHFGRQARRPQIAQPTPTILVNPDPPSPFMRRNDQATPTVYVDLSSRNRATSGPSQNAQPADNGQNPVPAVIQTGRGRPIAQPTPTILVNPMEVSPQEVSAPSQPAQPATNVQNPVPAMNQAQRRHQIAQPTPTICVNPMEVSPSDISAPSRPAQPATNVQNPVPAMNQPQRRHQIAQPTPTICVNPMEVSPPEAAQPDPAAPAAGAEEQLQSILEDPRSMEPQSVENSLGQQRNNDESISESVVMQTGGDGAPDADCATPFQEMPPLNLTSPRISTHRRQQAGSSSSLNDSQSDSASLIRSLSPTGQHPSLDAIPASGSQRAMTTVDADLVAVNIGANWKRMARNMSLPEGSIDAINHDYDRDGLYEKAFQTIKRWETVQGRQVPVGRLVNVLWTMGESAIAFKLEP